MNFPRFLLVVFVSDLTRCFEELPVFFVFIKVEIGGVFIITLAEFLEDPGLADLSDPFENQWFAIWGLLPFQKFLQNQSFHISIITLLFGIS